MEFRLFQKLARRLLVTSLFVALLLLCGCHRELSGVLNPKGVIAHQERELLFDSLALMLIVVIPVIVMSFAFVFRYRESHKTSEYKPGWGHSLFFESIWWGIPCVIIFIMAVMTWKMTHKLDPYRKMNVPGKPLLIEVVALPWKWLFIYPEQNIASVNFLELPVGRQVEFWLTTDNVAMSAFFIPQLGSQIFTMAGMRTRLHLLATYTGTFDGLNTQYNGDGFSDMHFKVSVVDENKLNDWFKEMRGRSTPLDNNSYRVLRKPTQAAPVQYYSTVKPDLFNKIIQSYKAPEHPEW